MMKKKTQFCAQTRDKTKENVLPRSGERRRIKRGGGEASGN